MFFLHCDSLQKLTKKRTNTENVNNYFFYFSNIDRLIHFHSDDLETPLDSANRFPQNNSDVIFDSLQVGTDYVITMTSQYDGLMRIKETVNVTTGILIFYVHLVTLLLFSLMCTFIFKYSVLLNYLTVKISKKCGS